jgi:predicted transcriptional regulator
MAEDFKTIASEFQAVSQEITNINRQAKELKNQKEQMAAAILAYLKSNAIDEVNLPEGARIVRKISKRSGTLKKDMILDEFKSILGDDAKAEHHLQNLYSRREVVEKEVVSLNMPRGPKPTQDQDDDE